MRNIFAVAAVLLAVAVAGCGTSAPVCGAPGQTCCTNKVCTAPASCQANNMCATMAACGTANLPCCTGGACTDGSTCTANMCVAAMTCGASGQACCAAGVCNTGLTCSAGTCGGMVGAPTGDPCLKAADCAGTGAVCVQKDSLGVMWPGGYCTSKCNPQKNDSSGINPSCPGGTGTCLGNGTQGGCETACTSMTGGMPCTRTGYSCFQSCEPTARSQCNPTVMASCPQDGGGVIYLVTDGGADAGTTTSSRSCARTGADDVGTCTNGCDPLYPQAVGTPSPPCKPNEGCYPSYSTGEGTCFATVGGGGEGTPCKYLNNCDPGYACRTVNMQAVCRKMCGGPNNVACPMNEMCTDLSMTVKKAVLGGCN